MLSSHILTSSYFWERVFIFTWFIAKYQRRPFSSKWCTNKLRYYFSSYGRLSHCTSVLLLFSSIFSLLHAYFIQTFKSTRCEKANKQHFKRIRSACLSKCRFFKKKSTACSCTKKPIDSPQHGIKNWLVRTMVTVSWWTFTFWWSTSTCAYFVGELRVRES